LLGFISFQGDTMTSDKQILEQALEFVKANHSGGPDAFELMDAIRARLEQPEERYTYGTPLLDAFTKPAPVQEPVAWHTVHKAVVITIEKCKTASGMHRAIDLVVNAAQITHDTLGTDTTPPTYDQGWKDGYKHGAWANTAADEQKTSEWQKIECPICGDMAIAKDIPAAPMQEPVMAWLLTGSTEVFHASEFTPDAENNQNGEWTALGPITTPPAAQPTGKAPCARHCEANAFQITIKNFKRDIERLTALVRAQQITIDKLEKNT
jgi:hypothetical protein